MDDHGRGSGFHIAVVDGRGRGDNSVQMRERVVVTGEMDRFTICRMCDNGVCSNCPLPTTVSKRDR
jgi:hypothetical protein